MNQQLTNFYDHLNTSVITTNDFAEGTLYRKREKVNQFAYCGLNPVYRKYLSFDLDYPDAGHKFEELKVPPPTIITTNRANGHAHYLYELITPVAYHQSARQKPQEYFEAVELEMTRQLKGDLAFTHTLTKNPLHDRWTVETFPTKYHLSDFTEYFDLPDVRWVKPDAVKCEIRGRNDELFHTLIPSSFISECTLDERTWDWLALDEQERHTVSAYLDEIDQGSDVESALEAFDGEHDSEEDWARDFWDQSGMSSELPEFAKNYIDYQQFARDASLGGDITFVNQGRRVKAFRR